MATRLPQRKDYETRFTSKADFREFLMQHSSQLGIIAWKNGKFAIRDEKTPSCFVNEGWYYDYGLGESGNIIDLVMHAHGLSNDIEGFKQACRIAEELLNMPRVVTGNLEYNNSYIEKEYLPELPVEKLKEYENNKQKNQQLFKKLLDGLARMLPEDKKQYVSEKLQLSLMIEEVETKTGFKFIDKRIFMPFFDKNGKVQNYCAYNRDSKLKAIKRKDGLPMLAGVNQLNSKKVLFVEGDSDYVHTQAYDLPSVTAGSASMKIGRFLSELKGKIVYFTPDNDRAGAEAIARWSLEIQKFNDEQEDDGDKIKAIFFWWSDRSLKIAKKTIREKVEKHFLKSGELNVAMKTAKTIKRITIKTTLNDGIVRKKGYDFVDFLEEFGESGIDFFKKFF